MVIPNCFHFVFGLKPQPQAFHLAHYLCLASCLGVNAPDGIYLYYHHEPYGRYWDLIRERIIPVKIPRVSFVDEFRYTDRRVARYKYAHASDFVRLEKVVGCGGVYADMDTLFVNPVPAALWHKPFVLGRENDVWDSAAGGYTPSVCNAFIMSERDAEFGKRWLQELGQAFDGTWSNHSTLLPRKLAMRSPELVHLEPARTFYKHMWTRQGIHTLLEGLDTDYDGVVSMHLWAHLWWSPLRRDFSTFHAGRLTEGYVRHKDTTYTVAARKFLPPPETRSFVMRQLARAVGFIAPSLVSQNVEADAGEQSAVKHRPRVLIVQPNVQPPGGGPGVAAWAITALQDEFALDVLTWVPLEVNEVNRFYGTRLDALRLNNFHPPSWLRRIVALDPDPWSLLPIALLSPCAKIVRGHYDAVLAFCDEVDFGAPVIQYIHFPYMSRIYEQECRVKSESRLRQLALRLRPWRLMSGFSFERMRNNVSLVNSDWTGEHFARAYDAPWRKLYPPVVRNPAPLPWAARDESFLSIGRLAGDKHYDTIVEILARVRAQGHPVMLHIVGASMGRKIDQPYLAALLELVQRHSEWVTLHENISRVELAQLMGRTRYGIHAKRDEHFGMAPAEMVRSGCIVFVFNDGGQVEIVGADDRLRYNSIPDAVEKIVRVLEDAAAQTELRTILDERAGRFTPEQFMTGIREVAAEMIRDRRQIAR